LSHPGKVHRAMMPPEVGSGPLEPGELTERSSCGGSIADGRILFIVNPRSGGGHTWMRNRFRIEAFIRAQRLDAEIALTCAAGHATHLARHAVVSGHTAVVVVGGDGTLNEV